MKILIEATWRKLEVDGNWLELIPAATGSFSFNDMIRDILTENQFNAWAGCVRNTFTLSKKQQEKLKKYLK